MKAEYVQHVGTDLTVVNSARVSFDKESAWAVDPDIYCDLPLALTSNKLEPRDEKLIHYLAKHNHWTPFAHCFVTLRESVPIFVARQRFKHTVGFAYNEVSRRYVSDEPKFFIPNGWRKAAANVKQGSSEETIDGFWFKGRDGSDNYQHFDSLVGEMNSVALDTYNTLLDCGVCPEQARMVLPQSMMTSYYVSGSLAAWARFYKLRIDPHAQVEIQDLAREVGEIIEPLFPTSWKALTS